MLRYARCDISWYIAFWFLLSLIGIMYVKLSKRSWCSFKNSIILLITFLGTLIGFGAAAVTFLDGLGVINLDS
jgi:uncharacterized membrane protein